MLHQQTRWRSRARNAIALALLTALGCEIADFDVERRALAWIPRAAMGNEFEMLRLEDTEIVLAELDDTHDIGREDISDAELTRLTIEVVEPSGTDLAFAQRIEVFAEAPGLERVRVAHQEVFPRGVGVVELETDDVELRDYVAAPTVTLVAVIDGAAPPTDVQVHATAILHLGVTVRGACDHAM